MKAEESNPWRLLGFSFTPRAHVESVEDKTKKIRGNESPLRRSEPDDANHDTVHGGQRPTFPAAPANQNGRNNG